jgi:hypothetical protein
MLLREDYNCVLVGLVNTPQIKALSTHVKPTVFDDAIDDRDLISSQRCDVLGHKAAQTVHVSGIEVLQPLSQLLSCRRIRQRCATGCGFLSRLPLRGERAEHDQKRKR